MKEKLTQEKLKELLDYDPETGIFTNKIDRGRRAKKGNVAGIFHVSTGYWHIKIDNKIYKAHRLAFLYMEGYLPENCVDHIDRNKINNKWDNLREVSISCNNKNCNLRKDNNSGITGVSWYKKYNKWQSVIKTPKQQINLGCFDNLIDAAKARWEAEIKYNYPNCNTTSSSYLYLKKYGYI